MLRHVILDLSSRVPIDCRFEILLSDRTALEIIARESISRAASLAEKSLGIGSPWARIDGISQLLVGQFLARDIDRLEPLQPLTVGSGAMVDHQLVAEYLL